MKVISGTLKGRKIEGYNIDGTRPTMDRVKESLFGIIQNNIKDSIVLDLFSGSGAIGIEFLSRGCKKAFLCDKSKNAINMIYQNLEKTRLTENATVLNTDFQKCLQDLAKKGITFDIIYIDPPYKDDIAVESVKMIFLFLLNLVSIFENLCSAL